MSLATTLRQRFLQAKPLQRFFSGKAPLVPPVKLHRRCIYILPTRAGLGYGMMILVMLIGAMNYQNNLAYLLAFTLIGLALVTMIETYRQLLNLSISIGHIEAVFCGQPISVPIIIKLSGGQRFDIELERQSVKVSKDVASPQDTLTLSIPTHQRGRHKLGLLRISSRFPLGLFYAWSPMPLAVNYLVYPAIEPHPPSPQQHASHDAPSGKEIKGDDDFTGIKAYHPGDVPRHIHWKAFAKGQGLLSKQFSSTQQHQHWIDWDDTQGLPLEQRLSRLCAWLIEAERNHEMFGLRMPNNNIELDHGVQHLHDCLQTLALYQQDQGHD